MGLDTVELVMDIEDRFDIKIPDLVASRCETVGDICSAVEKILLELNRPTAPGTVFADVRNVISHSAGVPEDEIERATHIVNDLGLD